MSTELAAAGPVRILTTQQAKELAAMTPRASMAGFQKFIAHNIDSIRLIAPTGFSAERLAKSVLSMVTRTPDLMDCTIASLFNAAIMCAECGWTPGNATGECAIVSFNKKVSEQGKPDRWQKEAQMMPMYRGLIGLARRSGIVKSVRAKAVYQGDHFVYKDGVQIIIEHEPDLNGSRDPKYITHCWCVINLDGGMLCDVMTKAEIDAIRGRSKTSGTGPWVTDYAEMAKKTVTKRALKYAPMSVEMSKAVAADDAIETGDLSILAEFDSYEDEPATTQTKTERTREKIAPVPAEPTPEQGGGEGQE